jgi:hypothetical protein
MVREHKKQITERRNLQNVKNYKMAKCKMLNLTERREKKR